MQQKQKENTHKNKEPNIIESLLFSVSLTNCKFYKTPLTHTAELCTKKKEKQTTQKGKLK